MTCIIAIKTQEGKVVMGGDSFCGGGIRDLCSEPKVYAIGNLGVGICGEVRSEQVLGRTLRKLLAGHVPDDKGAWTTAASSGPVKVTHEWIQNEMPDALRLVMKNRGSVRTKDDVQGMVGSNYLICFDGRIYQFDSDFGIWQSQRPYIALGCGHDLAKGAMHQIFHSLGPSLSADDAKYAAQVALEAAAEWSAYVCPPYTIIEV